MLFIKDMYIILFFKDGDPLSLSSRWEKWKRALQLYLLASDVTDSTKKRAILLLTGGIALQEIFYSLPGANVDSTLEENQGIDRYLWHRLK